jgi:hypothetical protein
MEGREQAGTMPVFAATTLAGCFFAALAIIYLFQLIMPAG